MARYSIADLERLSGVKAHTIRIWEQRYNLLQPSRTKTNIRYYNDDQLRTLLNIGVLTSNGYRISDISRMSDAEMYSALESLSVGAGSGDTQLEMFVNQLVQAGLSYSEYQFEKTFSTCLLRMGLQDTYVKVLCPTLEKLGLMWGTEQLNPCQEHFISNLIRQKLFTAIDALPPAEDAKATFVLFLPEDEEHEIGLLFASYLLRQRKVKVIYLGQRVPWDHVKSTVEQCKPTHLMTFLVHLKPADAAQEYLNRLAAQFPRLELYVSGNPWFAKQIAVPRRINWISTVEQFCSLLV